MKTKMNRFFIQLSLFFALILLLIRGFSVVYAQTSSNYKLNGYEIGGGGSVSDSTSFSLEGIIGQSADNQTSSNFKANSGLLNVQMANIPSAPTFVNSSSWYNKLKLTINKWSGDATDVKYAIAISTDAFGSDVKYVQSDNTVGSALGPEDFQTYATWGGGSGFYIIGLTPSTTYTVKVKAMQGDYTESGYGPTSSVATSALQISFDIDIGGSSDPGETGSPYSINIGSLTPGSVITSSDRIWVDLSTNAESGGFVYVYDVNAGLKSSQHNYTIDSTTANLASGGVTKGFGLQGGSKTQTSGGPLDYTSPYNGASDNVGVIDTSVREIFNSTNTSIVDGRGSVLLKAKSSSVTPASSDYADTLTLVATGSF